MSAPAAITLSRRPSKRKQWSDKEIVAVVKAVESRMGVKTLSFLSSLLGV